MSDNVSELPIEYYVKQLTDIANKYEPSIEVLNKIRNKKLLCLIGASAVGKSSIMKELVDNHGIPEVLSFVTRKQRDENDRYHFIDKTPENLQVLIENAKHGDMVNLFVHSGTGDTYGTWPADYEKSPCVLGVTSASYEKIEDLPLMTTPIAIVADPEIWRHRITERPDLTPEQIKIRAIEAEISLKWCLEKNGVLFVNNSGSLANSVEAIKLALDGSAINQADCRKVAEGMLKVAKALQ